MRHPPRIRTVLITTSIVVLLLPLGSIAGMRLYENELIRRTESELYAQGAFVTAAYREAVLAELSAAHPGTPASALVAEFGIVASDTEVDPEWEDDELRPIEPTLVRAPGRVLPPAPDPVPGPTPDAVSAAAGRFVRPILLRGKNITLAGIRVVDYRGTEVANTRGDTTHVSLLGWEEVATALTGRTVAQLRQRLSDEPAPSLSSRSRRTRVRVFVAMPVLDGERVLGAVVLSRTPVSLLRALHGNRRPLAIAGVALVLVVISLALFTSVTIARPIGELVAQTRAVRGGDLAAARSLERPGTREVEELSAAMAAMAASLADREGYIRTFATGVSHEFKTPLTSIRGAIELLEDHLDTMSADERARFIGVVASETDRLERLVSNLLELARADVLRPGDAVADVAEVCARVVVRHGDRGRAVKLFGPDGEIPAGGGSCPDARDPIGGARIRMVPEALDTVLSNLVDNAVQHGGADVEVAVRWGRDDGRVIIDVDDAGPGVSEANAPRVFDSFFTTDRAGGGTGVGLAIVRSLARAHGGDVALVSTGGPTRFRVTLPEVTDG